MIYLIIEHASVTSIKWKVEYRFHTVMMLLFTMTKFFYVMHVTMHCFRSLHLMVLMLLPTSVIWIAAKLVLFITGNLEVQRQAFSYIMFMPVLD